VQVRLADPTLLRSLADFLERAGYTPLPKTSETIDFVPPAAERPRTGHDTVGTAAAPLRPDL
jgi:hypothetical protein